MNWAQRNGKIIEGKRNWLTFSHTQICSHDQYKLTLFITTRKILQRQAIFRFLLGLPFTRAFWILYLVFAGARFCSLAAAEKANRRSLPYKVTSHTSNQGTCHGYSSGGRWRTVLYWSHSGSLRGHVTLGGAVKCPGSSNQNKTMVLHMKSAMAKCYSVLSMWCSHQSLLESRRNNGCFNRGLIVV